MPAESAEWIAVDWGTSNLRVWVMGPGDSVIDERTSDKGMGGLARDEFEPALLELVSDHLSDAPVPVICCGMVGAKQGWKEAAYETVPCPPPSTRNATLVDAASPGITVRILPGLRQNDPADVMRGEETQIAGFLAGNPDFEGMLCMPGTHSKWVEISGGRITRFRTLMTGEIFALLSGQSVLRHSVETDSWDTGAFASAVSEGLEGPQDVAFQLFGIRADSLLNGLEAAPARARLSGYLVGMELAATRPLWKGRRIELVGEPRLCRLYQFALEHLSVPSGVTAADQITLDGLKAAYHDLREESA